MAEYESTGVKLTAEGRDEYLAAIENARKATLQFNDSAAAAGPAFQTMSIGSAAAAVAIGDLFAGAVRTAIGAVTNMIGAGIEMTSQLQDTRIALESLIAQELIQAKSADTMTEAMEQAVPVTEAVMERLKEISLASPFEYQKILSVFQMAKAFGQSAEMSLDLTKSITDLAAVNRNVPGILERLVYNFSQMSQTGQITARDLRDLAMVGLNLGQVFEKQLGKSVDQVNDDLKSGAMTFEDVTKAFTQYVDENLGGAAERASRTFSGLQSSFNDLAFFSSIDVFGGALDIVTEKLGGFFNQAQEFVGGGGLKPIGAVLEVLTEQLLGAGEVAAQAGQSFFEQFGTQIINTATAAFDWGMNVTVQLGEGLIEGAAQAIVAAMDFVSGLLSFFLAPGSPPRVAPNIDRWGADAMTEYLRGFEDADFTTIKAVESSINSALGALVGAGAIDRGQQLDIFQGLSGQIAEVIATGSDLQPVLDAIRANLGDYGAEVAILTERQFALGKALEVVKAAEDALKKAREEESQANEDVIRLADEYNELAKAGASPEVLAAKRAEFEAAKKQREAARAARKEAEKGLETGQKEAKDLKEKADLQAQLVQQLIDLTKEQKEQEKKKPKGGSAKTGGAKMPAVTPPNFDTVNSAITAKIDELKETLRLKFSEFFSPLIEAWNNARSIVEPAWQNFVTTLGAIYDTYIQPLVQGFIDLIPPEFIQNIGWAAGVVGVLALAFGALSLVVGAVALVLESPIIVIGAIILAVAALKTAWDTNFLGIQTTLTNIWNNAILPIFGFFQNWLTNVLPANIQLLTDAWNNVLMPALQFVYDWNTNVLFPLFEAIADFLIAVFAANVRVLSQAFDTTLKPALESVWSIISTALQPTVETLSKFFANDLFSSVDEIVGMVGTFFVEALDKAIEFVGRLISALKELAKWFMNVNLPPGLTPGSPTPFETGLRGVLDAMDELNRKALPTMQAELSAVDRRGMTTSADVQAARLGLTGGNSGGTMVEKNYNLTLNTGMEPNTVSQGFEVFRVLGA